MTRLFAVFGIATCLWLLAGEVRAEPATQRGSTTEASLPTSLNATATSPTQDAGFFGFPVDKVLHASISGNLSLGFSAALVAFGTPRAWALLGGAGAALLVGLAKEAWDVLRTAPEQMHARLLDSGGDLLADLLGTGAGLVVGGLFTQPSAQAPHRFSFRFGVGPRRAFVTGAF